jgi:hypothetical protein
VEGLRRKNWDEADDVPRLSLSPVNSSDLYASCNFESTVRFTIYINIDEAMNGYPCLLSMRKGGIIMPLFTHQTKHTILKDEAAGSSD